MNIELALHVVEIEAHGITRQSAEQRKNDNAAFRKRRIRFPHARMSSTLGLHGETISRKTNIRRHRLQSRDWPCPCGPLFGNRAPSDRTQSWSLPHTSRRLSTF